MGNSAAAIRALATFLNHLRGRHGRPMFWKSQRFSTVIRGGDVDPLYVWLYPDDVTNGRTSTVRILCLPTETLNADRYAERVGGAATERTSPSLIESATIAADLFTNLEMAEFQVSRGAAAGAEIEEAIRIFDGYTIIDMIVYDDVVGTLDPLVHICVDPGEAKKGRVVTAGTLERLRDVFAELRTTNIPILGSWCATGTPAGWATPAASDETGIVITSAAAVNVQDQTIVARTATSPGTVHHVKHCGRGLLSGEGRSIQCMCRVFGKAVTQDAEVTFEGPNHVAGNTCTIVIPAGGVDAWHGGAADYVLLDASQDDDATGLGMNKVDCLGNLVAAGGTLYIHGLREFMVV